MRTRIRLPDGIEVWIEAPREDVQQAIRDAMRKRLMIDVNVNDHTMVAINPFQIVFIKDEES